MPHLNRLRPSRVWWLPLVLALCCEQSILLVSGFESRSGPNSFEGLMDMGRRYRDAGNCVKAIELFARAGNEAAVHGELTSRAKAILAGSGCEIRLFRYRTALANLAIGERLAAQAEDQTTLGAMAGNVSVIYSQLGDYFAAQNAAVKSVNYLKQSPKRDYYIRSLINLGEIDFGLGRKWEGKQAFNQAIEIARQSGLRRDQATASDDLGIWLVLTGELPEAERHLRSALSIRENLNDHAAISVSHEHLAELEEQKGGTALTVALKDINKALTNPKNLSADPFYYPLHVRGRIYQKLGRTQAALADFRRAVNEADQWRQSALPGDATNTRTVAQLTAVYRDYAHLAASLSLKTHNKALAREAFEVLAHNRAASLREQLTLAYRGKLLDSPRYFSLLQQLQVAQASVTLSTTTEKSEEARKNLDQIRIQLNDLENRLGLDKENVVALSENNRNKNLLRDIQSRLGESAALLSIGLGSTHSYLWTVTSTKLQLFQLPDRNTIEAQAREFRAAVHQPGKRPNLQPAGRALFRSLFGSLPPSVTAKPEWLIAADGELLDKMPFAALPGRDEHSKTFVIAKHSLRTLPSSMLPRNAANKTSADTFDGVGDPIYNRADPRFDRKGSSRPSNPARYTTLARLVGSKKELVASAQACGLPNTNLLTGREASAAHLRTVTAKATPEILHFAVHVVSPEGKPGEAALALSLTRNSIPELLTAEAVATYHVPGSLVVLSGCASQQGEVVPGSGLIGLSRSWLLAGATAVVVSAWPTPDDSGQFFAKFYEKYRQTHGSVSRRAAIALQLTQTEMARAGGYRGDPDFWAAYSIISKE